MGSQGKATCPVCGRRTFVVRQHDAHGEPYEVISNHTPRGANDQGRNRRRNRRVALCQGVGMRPAEVLA